MRSRLGLGAAVSALLTLVDIGLLLVLNEADVAVLAANAVAVGAATAASFAVHRRKHSDPFVRLSLAAAAVDIAVFAALVGAVGVMPAKVVSLTAAAIVRVVVYRRLLLHRLRSAQSTPAARGPAPGAIRFSVVVPAYCEAGRIGATTAALRAALPDVEHEIVVVDDGSADATADQARRAGADQVVVQPANTGKGAAVRAGIAAARGRTVAFIDADLAYPPEQLVRLLHEVEAGWDIVVGSRRHVDTTTLVRARRLRELSGRLFNLLTLLVLLGQYRDTQCGLKAFRSDVAGRLFARSRIDRFAFDVEVFHLAERDGCSLREIPVEVANTETSTVRIGLDAARMVRDLLRIRALASTGAYDQPPH